MKIKKSPEASLEGKRTTFVLMGFIFVLAVLYAAFEWTPKEVTVYKVESSTHWPFEEEVIQQTIQEETPPPPPPPAPDVIEEIQIVEPERDKEDIVFSSRRRQQESSRNY